MEVLPFRQYRVRMHHSGRVSLQNRRFLKICYTPLLPKLIPGQEVDQTALQQTPPNSGQELDQTVLQQTPPNLAESRVPTPTPSQSPTNPRIQGSNEPQVRRVPPALKNLQAYNQPGLKELPS